jgi:hypothetical protein
MRSPCRTRTLIWLGIGVWNAGRLVAQGVTGAALQGTVTGADSAAVQEATVLVTNISNGERWQTATQENGRFFLEHVSVGGPYRIDVRAVGFEPAQKTGIFLSLGERFTTDFRLLHTVYQLQEVTARATVDPLINAARTGPSQIVSESTIARLPAHRDFTDLARLAPQVNFGVSALSFAGQPDRLNGLQVDGTTHNDLFNSNEVSNGTIGGFGDLTALTVETVKDLQVITAPFDVRYGNFTGGVVNAVTKSGSNRFEGSVYEYAESQSLTGRDTTGHRAPDFSRNELGLTLGGPIARDRMAFFFNAGLRRQDNPQSVRGPSSDSTGGADSSGVGIRYASAVRFRDLLRNAYGVDPGSFASLPERLPSGSLFAKVTAQLGVNSRLEVSHNYFHANDQVEGFFHSYGFLPFSSFGFKVPLTVNATRLNWTTAFARRWTNELIVARLHQSNRCVPKSDFAAVHVAADAGEMVAGALEGCRGLVTEQSSWEVTDNVGLAAGAHRFTVGMHHELLHLINAKRAPSSGFWSFDSLDSLEQATPAAYERDLPGPLAPQGPRADFPVRQLGFYFQDQWTPTSRLTLTAGVRLDVPYIPTAPPLNPELQSDLGINTAVIPSGNVLWSPRLGVNFDLSGRGTTFLRSGVGLFAARPAYIWFREAYFDTGLQQLRLVCVGDATPAFTLDPSAQPTQCGGLEQGIPVIAYFDPKFRSPRSLKIALGGDQRLPWGVVGTVDLLYTRGVAQFEERDVNLIPPSGFSSGEGGRALYGTIDPADGVTEPNRRNSAYGPVIKITNGSGDRAWSLAFQLQKQFGGGTSLSAAYAYTDAKDRVSAPGDLAYDNLSATPLDGTWEHRNLRPSIYGRPHKVTLVGTFDLPLKLQLGLQYNAFSGDALTYVVLGDANADGLDNLFDHSRDNDAVYVPRGQGDITLADPADYPRLEEVIQEEPCLRHQRGRILQRNSCRQPWISSLDARLTKVLPTFHGHALDVSADLFNVLNFVNRDWGLFRITEGGVGNGNIGEANLLQLVGYDSANGRGIYNFLAPQLRHIVPDASRWSLRLSARYIF